MKRAHITHFTEENFEQTAETLCTLLRFALPSYCCVCIEIAQVKHSRNGSTVFMAIQKEKKPDRFVAALQTKQKTQALFVIFSFLYCFNSFSLAILWLAKHFRFEVVYTCFIGNSNAFRRNEREHDARLASFFFFYFISHTVNLISAERERKLYH